MNITNNLWNKSNYYNTKSSPNSLTNFMQPKQENIEQDKNKQLPSKLMGLANFNKLQNLSNKTSTSHVNVDSYVYKEKSILSNSVDESDDIIENDTSNDNDEKLKIEITKLLSGESRGYNGLDVFFLFPQELLNICSYDIVKTYNGLEFTFYDENGNEIPESSSKITFDELRDLGVPNEAIDAYLSGLYERPFGIFQHIPSYYKDEKDKDEKDVYTIGVPAPDKDMQIGDDNESTTFIVQLYSS